MVLDLLQDGLSFEQILSDYYPNLTVADIQACIQYAKSLVEGEEVYFAEEGFRD
jgi:uncharacterized protein (DUF433 family)